MTNKTIFEWTKNMYREQDYYPGSLPKKATQARPGTDEKIKIFRERLERAEDLFHPEDITCFRFEKVNDDYST
jgi:hypothetical protein